MSTTTLTRPAKPVRKNAVHAPSTDANNRKARLATLQAALREADEKLEAAYDRAERGEPYEVLLGHVAHDLLIGDALAMLDDSPTRAHAAANFEALFKPLAALQGTIALAQGSGIEGTLKEAFDLLDRVQDELDCCAELPKLLPEQSPQEPDRERSTWIDVDCVDGTLNGALILLDMASEACQFQYGNAESCAQAQDRLVMLIRASGNELREARDQLDSIVKDMMDERAVAA
ncbi:hypothetical protein [Variovorax sp. JS1663]|uniref:hypothetical protein n=1 Tax=Variovorax sp. JS1663 TaxID=1851577 RepID=UPI000B3493F2|nr:hypothetical protein [Variovorax sp. JS1663]OUM01784.1 hypothetical protein A8M77_14580 [Variovorax sp. JS1663]